MKRRPWSVALFGLAGILLALLLAVRLVSSEPSALRGTLAVVTPVAIEVTFLLLLAAGWTARKTIAASFLGHGTRALVLGAVAFLLASLLPPRTHRIYYDEDIYQNVAQAILWEGRAGMCNEGVIEAGVFECSSLEYNKEPNAFPVLLSLVFRFTGVDESAAHVLNRALFGLGVVCAYWLGCLFFRDGGVGMGAAVLYVLTPENLLWSATTAVEPGAAAFGALAVGAWLLFFETRSWPTAVFAASALAWAAQWRAESILLVGWVFVAAALFSSRGWVGRRFLVTLALLVLLLLPHLGHLRAVSGEAWGSPEGKKFSLDYVPGNLRDNAAYYFEGKEYPLYFTLLAVVGLLTSAGGRKTWLLFAWFVLTFGVFIPFHAGSYRYGADIRFSLLSAMPLAVLGGLGAVKLGVWLGSRVKESTIVAAAPLVVAVYLFTAYLPLVRAVGKEAWAARADHDAARDMLEHVPSDAIVLTHNPGMFLIMGQSAAQASTATYRPEAVESYFQRFSGGVYFHFSFWCNITDAVQNRFCTQILATYPTRVVFDRSAGFYRYVLYRVLPPLGNEPAP